MLGGVQVPVDDEAARLTAKRAIRERQGRIDPPATGAGLGRREPAVGYDDAAAIPRRLVRQLPAELPKPNVPDGLRETVVLQRPGHVEVFTHDDCLGFRQSARELLQRVRSLVGHFPILHAQATRGLLPILTALRLARPGPMKPLDLPQSLLEVSRGCFDPAV